MTQHSVACTHSRTHLCGPGHIGVRCDALHAGDGCCCHAPCTSTRCADVGQGGTRGSSHTAHPTQAAPSTNQQRQGEGKRLSSRQETGEIEGISALFPIPCSQHPSTTDMHMHTPGQTLAHSARHAPSSPHYSTRCATRLQHLKAPSIVVIVIVGRVVVTSRGGGSG